MNFAVYPRDMDYAAFLPVFWCTLGLPKPLMPENCRAIRAIAVHEQVCILLSFHQGVFSICIGRLHFALWAFFLSREGLFRHRRYALQR